MSNPPQILVEGLTRTYRVAERQAGTWGALKGLLRRRYRTVRALDGISFSMQPGELLGYIGPNGAGKSTTIKILSGILVPDSGRVEVFGLTPWRHRVETVGRIGVVFGQRTQLWWDLPVIESFDLLRDIYRVPADRYRASRDRLVELLTLGPLLDTPVRQLSLGQRMRCDLAAALLHEPEILFLDEPTIGLDATSKLAVRDFIEQLNKERGLTVILTTHDMDDIERLCSRIIVLNHGGIFLDGTVGELRARVSRDRWLIVDFEQEADAAAVEAAPGVDADVFRRDGHRVWLRFDPEITPAAALISSLGATHPIRDLTVENPAIEEIIARLYA
ncbi:MAG: ATP-binding cassette domain-containing protein [Planctomycetota bacterium]